MRSSGAILGVGVLTCVLAASPLGVPVASAATSSASLALDSLATAAGVSAYFEMNEPAGATLMNDSSGRGHTAVVDPAGIQTGLTSDGATGYNWVHRAPELAPPSPERIIQVPDSPDLEPGNGPFTIELRYRNHESFGNITQKGQATSTGGQWKIQQPGGIPSCLFKGSLGQVAIGSITPLNDDTWHNLTCVLTSTGVTMYVDGVYRSRKNGTTGTIDNTIPMTIGGKINCDQIDVTCDYYSGQIDYIKLTKAANLLPASAFTTSCAALTCTFDSSTAADDDGSLTRYSWSFGDATTSTSASPSHTFPAAGPYNVTLTVTDNQAATNSKTNPVTVTSTLPTSSVAFVGAASSAANNNNPTVTVPSAAKTGDRLLLALSYNSLSKTVSAPTGVTGWTLLDAVTANSMGSNVWTKVVAAGDAGKSVSVPLSGAAKYTLTVAAYTGADTTSPVTFARTTSTSTTNSRVTPIVVAPTGSWVASYWADKSSTTTTWTPSSSVTGRAATCSADGGRICSLLADSAGVVPAGSYGGISATTGSTSDMATTWSFVIAPSGGAPSNQAPTAVFTSNCTLLDCTFNSSQSTDPDGTIAARSWDFGDSSAGTGTSPTHHFTTAGTYTVVLTVTDDDGAAGTRTVAVTVTAAPVDGDVAFVGATSTSGNIKSPSLPIPAGTAPGDRVLLVLSLNSVSRTISAPSGVSGWTQLDSVTAGSMKTIAWTKVVQAGDVGGTVTVGLDAVAKLTLSVATYSGVDNGALTWSRATSTTNQSLRQAPVVNAGAGAWVVSYWADKSSTTTAWTPDASVNARTATCAADAGRICSALADSAGPVPAGVYGPVGATTNAPSDTATMWSIVLAPAP